MNLFFRSVLFLVMTILWYIGFFWYSLPILLWYSYKCTPWELLLLGLLVDIQFMTFGTLPWYTLFSFLWIILTVWLRPKFITYTDRV